MFYSVPISSNIITHSPIEAKSITHVFFLNKNDNVYQWKENPDTISISIDGKQIARDILVTPFMTSSSLGKGIYDWMDVALEVGINVNMSEIKITSNSNDNDYAVVFVCSDINISETGIDYVEWKKITISKQLGGQQLQKLVYDLLIEAEQNVRNRIVTKQNEALSNWQRYLDYIKNRDYIREEYFNSNKSQDKSNYINSIEYYVERFLGLYDQTLWGLDIANFDCKAPVVNFGNVQDTYDSALIVYHWYNSILLPYLDIKAYNSINHYFEQSIDDWNDIKPDDWNDIINKISSIPQYYLSDDEIAIVDASNNAPIFDESSEIHQETCSYWINTNESYLQFGFEKPSFKTHAEYTYCGSVSIMTVDDMYKKAKEESNNPTDEFIRELFGEKIIMRERTNDAQERYKWVYPLCENYYVLGKKVDCLTYYMSNFSQFSVMGKRSNIGFNTEYQIVLDYTPRKFFCISQCSKIIDINYNKSEARMCPNLTSFTMLCGDNVDIPSDMDMSIVSVTDQIPMRKALYEINNANRSVSITLRNIDPVNAEEHSDWDIYFVFISKRLL